MNQKRFLHLFPKVIFLCILMLNGSKQLIAQSTTAPYTVMLAGLDTLGFYSDVFYPSDFVYENEHRSTNVMYNFSSEIELNFKNALTDSVQFKFLPDSTIKALTIQSKKVEIPINTTKANTFVGFTYTDQGKAILLSAMEANNARYFISINLYEIIKDKSIKDQDFAYDYRAIHKLHYDIFDKNLTLLHSGIFEKELSTLKYEKIRKQLFSPFKLELETILIAKGLGYTTNSVKYKNLEQELKENILVNTGYFGVGAVLGYTSMYGIVGVESSYMFNPNVEINAGIGIDFSGMCYGLGARFMLGQNSIKPSLMIGISGNTGKNGSLTISEDAAGNVLESLDYKIFPDHALHLGVGLGAKLGTDLFLYPNLGYAVPFKGKKPEIYGIPTSDERNKIENYALGGFEISIHLIYQIKKY